jgi:transketolase
MSMAASGNEFTPALIGASGDSLREAFGKTLVELAEGHSDFVVLDADVAGGTGVHHFRKAFPERFYQFGIAEQNMMSAAAGFASYGLTPFVTTFAVFCLRALEQVRLTIAYPRRNVKIVASHPGLDVGPDGASAQCLEDLAAFRAIPNMIVLSPADQREMAQATEAVLHCDGPVYMRSGRSPAPRILDESYRFEIGKGRVLREGSDVGIIACGVEVARSLEAAQILSRQGVSARVVNMSTIKPLDVELLAETIEKTGCLVTAEDHSVIGGLGGAVAEAVVGLMPCPVERVGVRDCFGESGEPEELAVKYGLAPGSIAQAGLLAVERKKGFVR